MGRSKLTNVQKQIYPTMMRRMPGRQPNETSPAFQMPPPGSELTSFVLEEQQSLDSLNTVMLPGGQTETSEGQTFQEQEGQSMLVQTTPEIQTQVEAEVNNPPLDILSIAMVRLILLIISLVGIFQHIG
jgi:hypothetical protein